MRWDDRLFNGLMWATALGILGFGAANFIVRTVIWIGGL